jgi:hypothetical protein
VVEPAGKVIACEDCHAPEGNFEWIQAGFTTKEASQFIWSDYPASTPRSYRSEPPWVGVLAVGFGIAIAINFFTVIALVTRRSS